MGLTAVFVDAFVGFESSFLFRVFVEVYLINKEVNQDVMPMFIAHRCSSSLVQFLVSSACSLADA